MPHNAVFLLTIQSLGGITIQYRPILEGKMSTPTIYVYVSALKTNGTHVPVIGRLVTKAEAVDLVDALEGIEDCEARITELQLLFETRQIPTCGPFEISKPELYVSLTYAFQPDSYYPDFVELRKHASLVSKS